MSSPQGACNVPVRLVLADGNEYTFDRVGLDALCEFCDWIVRERGGKPGENVQLDDMARWMNSLKGIRWLLWRAMMRHHPQLKRAEDVGALFTSIGSMKAAIDSIVDMGEPDEASAEGNVPAAAD